MKSITLPIHQHRWEGIPKCQTFKGFVQISFYNSFSVIKFQHLLVVSTPGFRSISVKIEYLRNVKKRKKKNPGLKPVTKNPPESPLLFLSIENFLKKKLIDELRG
jgi:hypothetical protein